MSGGLMQLVAYGAQDIYLTGNAQITFFKVVYRRHTNFSMESIEQTFNGQADFGKKVTATISRNGDLIHRVYLQVTLPEVRTTEATSSFRWLNWLGHVLVKNVEVEIGGQRIDKHYGDWMHIWNELTQTAGHQAGYANMVGNVPRLTQPVSGDSSTGPVTGSVGADPAVVSSMPQTTLFVPLQFWFCRNPGLALPLIALQYHEVKINLEFREAADCFWKRGVVATPQLVAASLWVDYIYLDTDERRRFAQVSHEYLIEQLQFTGDESVTSASNKIKLNFNHPVKELVWVVQPDSNVDRVATLAVGGPQWFNYTDRVDESYFSGTPQDPLGGGMGGASALVGNFPFSLPLAGGLNTTSPNPASGLSADILVANSGDGATEAGTSAGFTINDLTFPGLLGGAGGWSSGLRVFDKGENPVAVAKLQLNGHDRFAEREGRYFNLVQPFQHHENVPATGINVYSFALKPEEHQPSGTCNFSRIDNATLHLTLTRQSVKANRACKVRIYAVNYNVLRIMSGMGGLAYSN
jgi:Large eukaryotic DNA virus major capsid protein/Major capsid protein N-terminus